MRRRAFVATAALSIPGWRGFASAQPLGRAARIGRLSPLSREADEPMIAGLLAGLRERGWTEGSNLADERRYADGDGAKLSAVANELVSLNVDVIVTGSNPGALAAKRATSRIPVVFVTTGDPV